MTLAYVGLGANLGDAPAQLRAAMDALDALPDSRVVARSPLYATAPWGIIDQPEFTNGAVALETSLPARTLLDALHAIEAAAGRRRDGQRWGPRTLDLDLLLYGQGVLADGAMRVPHPHLAERAFVLVPLADIAADLEVPGQGRVADLLRRVDARGCRRLDAA